MEVRDKLFIGGEWVAPAGSGWIEVVSPVTEEVFARVPDALPADEDDAVAIANDSPYGLGGGVWTRDVAHGAELATRIRTGVVAINSAMLLDFRSPFGGFKKSGIGRELGPEGIGPYTEYQSIILPAGS